MNVALGRCVLATCASSFFTPIQHYIAQRLAKKHGDKKSRLKPAKLSDKSQLEVKRNQAGRPAA